MNKVSIRYIVLDVDAAITFYTEMLDFQLNVHPAPGFARLSKENLSLLLNQPGAGGAGQTLPNEQIPHPGGWNRIQVEVDDLKETVETLRGRGCTFRSEIVIGNGGKQIILEDPFGNPIELFEAA